MTDIIEHITILAKRRDAHLILAESYNDELELLKPTEVKEQLAVSEDNFNLNYKEYESEKLKFQVADPKDNSGDKFQRAENILKQANATINNRYHGPDYVYSFWLYSGRIYRQKLKG